jgi:DNA-binding GntR family transcriptional regulator
MEGSEMQLQSGETLDHTVYNKIKEMIVNQELSAGKVIVQNQISKVLGVSRTPVRKALGELEKEGLLGSSPKGWFVKEFKIDDLISIFEIRSLLEGLACRIAARKITNAQCAYFTAMFEEAYTKVDEHQAEEYYIADIEFHQKIIDIANDPILKQTMMSNQIILKSQIQGLYRSPKETYPEHLEMIKALKEKDGEKAEILMRNHIKQALHLLKSGSFSIYK